MKKIVILSTILVSVFVLAGCGSKKKNKTSLEEELRTFATLESAPKEVVLQLAVPAEVMKISQDNTGSKEFIPADQLKVVKVTTDTGAENTVHLLNSLTDEKIDALLTEDGSFSKYIYRGNNLFLTQFLLAIDTPAVLTEIQSYLVEELVDKQYVSEKFNYQINHNKNTPDQHAPTIVQVTPLS